MRLLEPGRAQLFTGNGEAAYDLAVRHSRGGRLLVTSARRARLGRGARLGEIVLPCEDPDPVPGHKGPLRVHKLALRHHLYPLLLGDPRLHEGLNVPLHGRVREYAPDRSFRASGG